MNFPMNATAAEPVVNPDTRTVPPTSVPPIRTWIGTTVAAALSALVMVFVGGSCGAALRADSTPLLSSIDAMAEPLPQSVDKPAMP